MQIVTQIVLEHKHTQTQTRPSSIHRSFVPAKPKAVYLVITAGGLVGSTEGPHGRAGGRDGAGGGAVGLRRGAEHGARGAASLSRTLHHILQREQETHA